MNPSSSHASNDDSGSKGDGEESCYVSLEWDRFWDYFRANVDDGSINGRSNDSSFCVDGDDGNIDRSNDSSIRADVDDGNIGRSND